MSKLEIRLNDLKILINQEELKMKKYYVIQQVNGETDYEIIATFYNLKYAKMVYDIVKEKNDGLVNNPYGVLETFIVRYNESENDYIIISAYIFKYRGNNK